MRIVPQRLRKTFYDSTTCDPHCFQMSKPLLALTFSIFLQWEREGTAPVRTCSSRNFAKLFITFLLHWYSKGKVEQEVCSDTTGWCLRVPWAPRLLRNICKACRICGHILGRFIRGTAVAYVRRFNPFWSVKFSVLFPKVFISHKILLRRLLLGIMLSCKCSR